MPATKLSLRERKFAQTKLNIMNAALQRLETKSLEDISVKELCDAALVSEATFFNYFPRKSDILSYYAQLWTVEIGWHARREAAASAGLAAIQTVFKRAAAQIQQRPRVMGEIIAHLARSREKTQTAPLTPAEYRLAFPDFDGVEELPVTGLDAALIPNLQQAIKQGELPANTPLHVLMVGLISIFYGVPLALMRSHPEGIASMYLQHLSLLWHGVRAATAGSERARI